MQNNLHDSSKILFLSDVHLGAFSESKNRLLEWEVIQLLDFAEAAGYQLAVLGDLFDYWIEYPSEIPSLGGDMLHRFQRFNRDVGPVLYVTGNHDNWTFGHFAALGFDVEPTYRLLTINEFNILLAHGDATGPAPEELERPLIHRFIRNKHFLKVYRTLLPPSAGLAVMKRFSRMSRMLGGETANPAALNNWAEQMLKQGTADIDLVLCGHDHHPRTIENDYGTYINLGTFYRDHTLAEYNNGRMTLVKWNNKTNNLSPLNPQSIPHE
jgi:UDP-2,3-diacylglucosamine pyrophosphatase LpxH